MQDGNVICVNISKYDMQPETENSANQLYADVVSDEGYNRHITGLHYDSLMFKSLMIRYYERFS